MKKKFTFIAGLIAAVVLPASALAATVATEGFEGSDLSSWSSVGTNWVLDTTEKHTGNSSLKVTGTLSEASSVTKSISTLGFTNIGINFWYMAPVGLTDLPEPNDEVFLEYSLDEGVTWVRVKTIDESSADGVWYSNLPNHPITLPSDADNKANVLIRFSAVLKDVTDAVNIDDLEVTGDEIPVVPPTPPAPPTPPTPTIGSDVPVIPPDADGDSVPDATDNCITTPNFDQADANENGVGDACDDLPEDTLLLCTDGIDNDHDSLVDIADESCVNFRPSIIPAKVIINNTPGMTFTDFLFHWVVGAFEGDFSMPSGNTWLTFPFSGAFSVTEYAVPGYVTTYSEGCSGTLSTNQNTECVITNDGATTTDNGGGDIGDPVGDENTLELCTDGFDNNDNELIDAADPSCAAFTEGNGNNEEGGNNNPPPAPSVGGSSTFDYWGCTNKDASNFNTLANKDDGTCVVPTGAVGGSSGEVGTTTGEVLGAATTTPELALPAGCTEYIHSYMGRGKKNDAEDVARLQTFLNETMGANIPVTGFFGNMTKNWVKKFQAKYHDDIIKPWYDAGYKGRDIENGTGYVYKTTKREVNLMKCSELKTPLPDLTPDL